MSEQNTTNTQPMLEDVIREKLTGETQQNALDFVAFMRGKSMVVTGNDKGEGWAVGGTVGDSVGYLLINGAEQFPGPWTLWFNGCDFGGAADDALKETAWAHASPCGKCHAGWATCGGGDRVIFGKAFERLCHSPLMFHNPDAETLVRMEKLMLMLQEQAAKA